MELGQLWQGAAQMAEQIFMKEVPKEWLDLLKFLHGKLGPVPF